MKSLLSVLVTSVVALWGQVAVAQTTFNGLGDGTTWEDPLNWDNGAPAANNANIHDGFTVDLTSATSIAELDIAGDQGPGEATLNHSAGALTGSGWLKIGLGEDAGTYNLSGTASASGFGVTIVGDIANTNSSVLSITDDASLQTGELSMQGPGGFFTISGNGTLTAAQINGRDEAIFQQSGGQVNVDNWVSVGNVAGTGATYNLSGGSLTNTSDWITFGEDGTGTLNVSGTGTISANGGGIIIGRNGSGNGTMTITGSTASIAANDFRIGINSDGVEGGTGLVSWIADGNGITSVVSADNTHIGVAASLSVDLTADDDFAGYGSGAGTLEIVLIDNVALVSGTFPAHDEGTSVDIGGGKTATISYLGGDDGVDVVLQVAFGGCAADVDGNGVVGFSDLLEVLSGWGPCVGCPADVDNDGNVGFADLLEVLADWGPC